MTFTIYNALTEQPANEALVDKAFQANKNDILFGANRSDAVGSGSVAVILYVDQDGLAHREHDFPAVIYTVGDLVWMKRGLRHRDDGKLACTLDPQPFTEGKIVRKAA